MRTRTSLIVLGTVLACGSASAQTTLASYNVDPSTVTVSGISSGAFMAVQLQVAYSSRFTGAAIIAGGPFYCAQDSIASATGACESGNGIPVATLVSFASNQAAAGTIDPVSNIAGKPIYMFSGTQDMTVHQATMNALQQFYGSFTSASNVTYDNSTAAAHGWISLDGPNGCDTSYVPYINNCNKDVEQTFLGLFYGSLTPKNTGALSGSFVQFDQTAFCPGNSCSGISMDSTGWAFVPKSCAGGESCTLVVALHGCLQYQGLIQQQFVQKSGLDEWADTNGIIVLYPQATTSLSNSAGCWDWWGYTSSSYALKSAPQMTAIMAMVDRITLGSTSNDAGTQLDAGQLGDAGVPNGPDSGLVGDSGTGSNPDAGANQSSDSGSALGQDAGAADAGVGGTTGGGCQAAPGGALLAFASFALAQLARRARRGTLPTASARSPPPSVISSMWDKVLKWP
jgi:uncharacterized protein (TIGR03382 family)